LLTGLAAERGTSLRDTIEQVAEGRSGYQGWPRFSEVV
jgi:hypothetical protein